MSLSFNLFHGCVETSKLIDFLCNSGIVVLQELCLYNCSTELVIVKFVCVDVK